MVSARPAQVVEGKGEHRLTDKIASEQQALDQGRETLLSPHRLAREHNPARNELNSLRLKRVDHPCDGRGKARRSHWRAK
jgi:hypothetical protein